MKKKKSTILIISYFDQIKGPTVFYGEQKFKPLNSSLLDMLMIIGDEETPFPVAFEKFQTLNYKFHIHSKFARGGNEIFMITYVVNESSAENFKSLKFKSQILKEFAYEMQNMKEIPKILFEKRQTRKKLRDLGPNKFRRILIEKCNKYNTLLTLPLAGKPQKE